MRIEYKSGMLIVIPDDDADRAGIDAFGERLAGHVFRLFRKGSGMQFADIGDEDTVRNVPINITSRTPEPLSLISNFADTPFTLDGRGFACVEAFWQGLKFADPDERVRVAELSGFEARRAAAGLEQGATFDYEGATVRTGTFEHWRLMQNACRAKFSQNEPARQALLWTGNRPLAHRVRHDSRTIPGVVMADIWMRIRAALRKDLEGLAQGLSGQAAP